MKKRKTRTYTRAPIADRFWSKVKKSDACWEWTGAKSSFGHGLINEGGRGSTIRAHRLSWTLHYGAIDDGKFVCHRCDNPSCVRPDHLFVGTHADNMADCKMKGRYDKVQRPKGERHGMSVLSAADVAEIRSMWQQADVTLAHLSKRYGVSIAHIHRIVHGKSWRVD